MIFMKINSNQNKKKSKEIKKIYSVPAGFEPAAFRLTVECSNQLSYGTLYFFFQLLMDLTPL